MGDYGIRLPVIDQEAKNATVKAGLDGGVNWFDTAELYGSGVLEKSLSTALKAAGKKDEDVIIATKWWPLFSYAAEHTQKPFMTGFASWMFTALDSTRFISP